MASTENTNNAVETEKKDTEDSWDDAAAGWDTDPIVNAYSAAALVAVKAELVTHNVDVKTMRVLDFGCGTGILSLSLASECREVVSLDPSEKMIAALCNKVETNDLKNVHPMVGTLEEALADARLSASAPFDLVVCSSVCAFLDDYPATAKQLGSLLKGGGVFVQFDWEFIETDKEPFGLTRPRIEKALTDAGFDNVVAKIGFEAKIEDMTMKPLMGVGQRPLATSK
eukprot:m.23073 g.23073  ORF g.23073 m.23073 type:complete len:227 (+) comp14055_c0_seq1:188-868(+)